LIRYGQNMTRIQEDPEREDRIENEAVVDAYGEEERAMGYERREARDQVNAKIGDILTNWET